jgi:hypothetical protein
MIGGLFDSPWKLLIVAAVLIPTMIVASFGR